jgi:hypothetical protein
VIETTVKLIDNMFLPKLSFCTSTHIPVLPEQYGFRTGISGGDQMTELLHDVRETKRAAGLVSVDLKGAYGRARSEKLLQFLHSKVSRRNGTILEPLNADQTSQGCFPKQSRFNLPTRP